MDQNLPPLVLGVKRSTWRKHDPDAEEANADFEAVRRSILTRDRHTCRYCKMRTLQQGDQNKGGQIYKGRFSGYFEVHHMDDNHQNNDPSNLLTVCPFCHSVFHCGNAGHRESGSIIWAPWIRQEDLNAAVHVLFILMQFEHPDEQVIKKAQVSQTQENLDFIIETGKLARERYQVLQSFGDLVEKNLGEGMSSAATLGESLMVLGKKDDRAYQRRQVFLGGARFLPDFGYYMPQTKYWSKANNFQQTLIHADKLKSHFTNAERITRQLLSEPY